MTALAFRKGSDTLLGSLIRLRTGSIYSHVELVLDGGIDQVSTCFSASWMDDGVRTRKIRLAGDNWDVVPVHLNLNRVADLQRSEDGKPYDRMGILTWGTPFASLQDKDRWFCSELAAEALRYGKPWTESPASLAADLTGVWR